MSTITHLALEYQTQPNLQTISTLQSTFQWKTENQEPVVQTTNSATATIYTLFQTALQSSLTPISTIQTHYSDGSVRPSPPQPIETSSLINNQTIKAHLKQYLYENLTAAIGLAATTGEIDITLDTPSAIDDVIPAAIAFATTESQTIRRAFYDQMVAAAPERFPTSTITEYQSLPFQPGDTLSVRLTFQFPASLMTAPVSEHVLRIKNSNLFVAVGNKIQVSKPQTASPVFQDFPSCSVLLRVKVVS